MRIRVQVVIEGDEDVPPEVHEVADLQRGDLGADTLGLQLAEAKELLARVQEVVVDEQVRACLAARIACPHCRRPRHHKDTRTIAVRTLFGTLRLPSPRWHHCPCQPQERQTFSPLAEILPGRTTPELLVKAWLAEGYLEVQVKALHRSGDLALEVIEWTLGETDSPEAPAHGLAATVLSRHPDGAWRMQIDNCFILG